MNDYDDDPYFIDEDQSYIPQQNVVNVYRDRDRVGHTEVMATTIEYGHLRKIQESKNFFDPEQRLIAMIESYFYEVKGYYPTIGRGDLQRILDLFRSLPNKLYKNPYMLVLGYILHQNIRRSDALKTIRDLIKKTGQQEISETDVIRYYRLLRSNPLLRS